MTANPQSDETGGPGELDQVKEYRKLVLEYEALDEEIDALLAEYNGATENMPDEEYYRYRELAHHRDYIYNRMKELERQLFADDDAS